MRTWLNVRSTVLDETVTHDGPGNNQLDSCSSCGSGQQMPLYRCLECSYGLLCCSDCILKSHTMLPLHRLEVRLYFRPDTLMLTTPSAGKTVFSTGPLFIHSDMSAISGMAVTRVLQTPLIVNSSSSTSTVGINYKSDFASAVRAVCPTSIIANFSACAGTLLHSIVRKPLSRLTSSKHTIKLRCKENSIYMISIMPLCINPTIKGGRNRW